jgi:hypothetical protein
MVDKVFEIQSLAEDILNDFELSKLSFESILYKIKKLARIREDYETINWVSVELNGYSETRTIADFPHKKNGYMQKCREDTAMKLMEKLVKKSRNIGYGQYQN